jgi:YD repeat-containing protein
LVTLLSRKKNGVGGEFVKSRFVQFKRSGVGNTNSYTYGQFRELHSHTDAKNNTTTNNYDSNTGDLLWTRDRMGRFTQFTYDGGGNTLTLSNALGHIAAPNQSPSRCLGLPQETVAPLAGVMT